MSYRLFFCNSFSLISDDTSFLQKIPYNPVIHRLVGQMQFVVNETELDHVHVWKDIKEILTMVAVLNVF